MGFDGGFGYDGSREVLGRVVATIQPAHPQSFKPTNKYDASLGGHLFDF